MFSHIMLGANNIEESKRFYDATMAVLSYKPGVVAETGNRCMYLSSKGVLALTLPINGESATHGNGSTIGLSVTSPELVDAWHAVGVENGGIPCEDPPGVRVVGGNKMYLAYLRDPAGNKLCATHFMPAEG
ncbi:VOC family protein [Oceanisphaera arctica]|uniref:Glyoxalase n=1 Tax=Oceanisphaera arctica TaxID=641510 RepID=A0A2P5TQY4_9GAMM|nr:VOC family protein [Oceanisphaera arctica]PPL18169.1 glyoxalase [Oceanisphaera arctica]GHA21878.1 hypothetical protein GCM10007082_23350 [Oceanisphaera arctica]